MVTSKIKKGDTVKVITGKYKGTEGKVISVKEGKGHSYINSFNTTLLLIRNF